MTMYIIITSYTKDNYKIETLETKSLKKAYLQHILIEAKQEREHPEGRTEVTLHHGSPSVGDFEEYADITHSFKHHWKS